MRTSASPVPRPPLRPLVVRRSGWRTVDNTTSLPMSGCVLPPTKTQAAVPDETLAHAEIRSSVTGPAESRYRDLELRSCHGGRRAAPCSAGVRVTGNRLETAWL